MRKSRVHVAAEQSLQVVSVRQSRRLLDCSPLSQLLWDSALSLPARPTEMSGDAERCCSWIEPRAWVITSMQPMPTRDIEGLLATEVSDRTVAFRITGECAIAVVAAGCDPAIVCDHGCTRARFANLATIVIQRWSKADWRLMVDVSVAHVFADWLEHTATSVAAGGT